MNAHLRAVPAIKPRAVLYLRQSVHRDDSISMELQEIAGRDHCTKNGYEVIAVERDEGISGRTWSKRPAVQRAIDMIEKQEADVIVIWKWSRLSRSRKDWALAADRVAIADGRIESATEPIDTATASGRFARGVMTEYAAFQSEQIGEQWEEIRTRRFNLGLPPAGSVPYGWKMENNKVVQTPDEAQWVRKMYDMYFEGKGNYGISSFLNAAGAQTKKGRDWLPVSVRKTMESPINAGFVHYRGEIRKGAHQGIITVEEWEHFWQMKKNRHKSTKIKASSEYLLSSLVVCHCGRKRYGKKYRARNSKVQDFYYSYQCPSSTKHPNKALAKHVVDNAVIGWLKNLPKIAATSDVTQDKIDTQIVAREITALEKQLVKLTEHLLSGLVPEAAYRETRDQLTNKINSLKVKLDEVVRAQRVTVTSFLTGKEDLIESWDLLDLVAKQELVRVFVATVHVSPDNGLSLKTTWGETAVIGQQ